MEFLSTFVRRFRDLSTLLRNVSTRHYQWVNIKTDVPTTRTKKKKKTEIDDANNYYNKRRTST